MAKYWKQSVGDFEPKNFLDNFKSITKDLSKVFIIFVQLILCLLAIA
jgi:hypothetical protein